MKRKQKGNGAVELEIVQDGGPDKYVAAVLHAHLSGEPPVHPDADKAPRFTRTPLPKVWPMAVPEAAILRHGEHDESLFIRWGPNRGTWNWQSVARFKPETVGSHQFIRVRRFAAPITGVMLGSLERIHGREYHYSDSSHDLPAAVVELQDCVAVVRGERSWLPMCRYRDTWLNFGGLITGHFRAPSPEALAEQRRRGGNHPGIPIV